MKKAQLNIHLDEGQQEKLEALLDKYRQQGLELRPVDIGRMALNRLFDQENDVDPHEKRTLQSITETEERCTKT